MNTAHINIERRDSGPAWQDRTSDEWFEPVTDDQVEAQDSLFGMLPSDEEQRLRGLE